MTTCLLSTAVAIATSASPSLAQTLESCSCAAQLDALIGATQSNYAGYADKVRIGGDSVALARHGDLLRARARRTMGVDCFDILKAYIGWFRDGHLQVRSSSTRPLNRAPVTGTPVVLPDRLSAGSDRILGLWESTSRRTRLQIVPATAPYSERDRYGVILASADTTWAPGDVYATFVFDADRGIYHGTWFVRGRQPQEWPAVVVDDTLLLTGFSGWHRIDVDRPSGLPARHDPLRPSFRQLSPGAALLSLPSMQVQYAAHVDSLVRAHAEEIGRLNVLVIDLRGNQGGGDGTYMPLLPLLYTDTIVTVAGSVLSSPANIAFYEQFLDPAGVNSPKWVVDMLAEMRERPGAQIALPSSQLTYDRVQAYPRDIAILTDAVGASSTETFLLKAVQSTRVRHFGQPTAGIVDYLNPAQHQLGCGVTLQAPTIRRSTRLPADAIDNRGIAPHVLLPWTEPDPIGVILSSYERWSRTNRKWPVCTSGYSAFWPRSSVRTPTRARWPSS